MTMARNYKELQEQMHPASRAENRQLVREELQRMALDELRNAKQLTQADMAEMLDVPQSSISRIEQRADMYLSTLRNYIHAMGGVLQIQAVFPDGGAVAISRLGDYEDQSSVVRVRRETGGTYRLFAPGVPLSTKALKVQAFTKTLKALHLAETQIVNIRKALENGVETEIGGVSGKKLFNVPELVAAGFETVSE
jgi:transcriptional regulator with XRE-family HTH domain